MKFWGLIVAFLYVVILAVLLSPLEAILFYSPHSSSTLWQGIISSYSHGFGDAFFDINGWYILAIVLVAQGALLTVPVSAAEKRPVTKRSVIPLVLATSFMMMLLVIGGIFVLFEVFNATNHLFQWTVILLGVFIWFFWALIFFRWSKKMEPLKIVEQQCRWLYRGSILELLVAVPSHIYARQRTDCCAGYGTFIGITFGIAVMFFSFGPGVFFLFKERLDHLKKRI